MSNCRRLEWLRLDFSTIKYLGGIELLKNIRNLSIFIICSNDLTPLKIWRKLKIFEADYTNIESIEPLKNSDLRHVSIAFTPIIDLSPVVECLDLEYLNASNTNIEIFPELPNGCHLRYLNISNTPVRNIEGIENAQALERLNIHGTKVNDISPLASITSLIDAALVSRGFGSWRGSLQYNDTPAATRPPFNGFITLGEPRKTLGTINALRQSRGLPIYLADGTNKVSEQDEEFSEAQDYADALTQRPATFAFSLRTDRIHAHAVSGQTSNAELARDFYHGVKEKAREALERLFQTNAPIRVQTSIERLLAGLGRDVSELRPGILQMRFRSIEADIRATTPLRGRLELGEDVLAILSDLGASVEDLMGCYPQLATLEAQRLAQGLQQENVPAIAWEMKRIQAAAEQSDTVTTSANEALAFAEDAIHDNTEVIELAFSSDDERAAAIQARAKIFGQKLLDYRNFVARVLAQAGGLSKKVGRAVVRELGELGEASWDETKVRFPRGVGKAAERIGDAAVSTAFVTLAGALVGPLTGLAALVTTFKPLARRSQEITAEASPRGVRPAAGQEFQTKKRKSAQ